MNYLMAAVLLIVASGLGVIIWAALHTPRELVVHRAPPSQPQAALSVRQQTSVNVVVNNNVMPACHVAPAPPAVVTHRHLHVNLNLTLGQRGRRAAAELASDAAPKAIESRRVVPGLVLDRSELLPVRRSDGQG